LAIDYQFQGAQQFASTNDNVAGPPIMSPCAGRQHYQLNPREPGAAVGGGPGAAVGAAVGGGLGAATGVATTPVAPYYPPPGY